MIDSYPSAFVADHFAVMTEPPGVIDSFTGVMTEPPGGLGARKEAFESFLAEKNLAGRIVVFCLVGAGAMSELLPIMPGVETVRVPVRGIAGVDFDHLETTMKERQFTSTILKRPYKE